MQRAASTWWQGWVPVHGLPMYARVHTAGAGGAPPVVLVHGLGVSGLYLLPTAVRLAPFFPTYVPDLPGCGRSAKPARVLDVPQLADALAAWMHAWGLAGACLVGNSMGCQVILDVALRHPELVRGAVLLGPTMDPEAPTVLAQIFRGAWDLLGEPLHYWPLLLYDYLMAGPVRTLATLRLALRDRVLDKLPHIAVPTLVVRGSRDPIAPPRWVERVAAGLPRGQAVTIPGATHVANYTAPDAVARLVRDFLAGVPATAGDGPPFVLSPPAGSSPGGRQRSGSGTSPRPARPGKSDRKRTSGPRC